jgi:hypothetical protein
LSPPPLPLVQMTTLPSWEALAMVDFPTP